MTMVVPCRLITRQRSHMGLTDGRTFMGNAFVKRDTAGAHRRSPGDAEHYRTRTFAGSVRMRGPSAVTATVCSKWAARDSSTEEIDHLSAWT